jgi:hypothetical protein
MEQEEPMSAEQVARKSLMDRREQSDALEKQIKLLTQSLDSRMSPGFDVPLMQMAAGFLKPTKTGSFGESLGYGMENYSKAADEEFARKQLADKQRLEYMQKLADIQKQRGLLDYQLADLGGPTQTVLRTGAESAPPGAPAGTPPAGGAISAPSPSAGAPAGAAPNPMAVQGSNRPMTIDRAKMASAMDDKLGEAAWKQLEAERKQIELQLSQVKSNREGIVPTQFGMWDQDKKEWVEKDPYVQKSEEFDFGPAGPRKTTADVYREYKKIIAEGTDDQLRDFYIRQRWLAGKPSGAPRVGAQPAGTAPANAPAGAEPSAGAKPSAGGAGGAGGFGLPSRFKTEDEKNQEKIANEASAAEAKKYAEGAGEMASNLRESALSATDVKSLAQEAGSIAKAAPNAFKLLQNKDSGLRTELDGYLQAVKTGAQTPWGTFSIPTDIIERNGLSDREIQALQKYAQIEAQFTLFNRRLWLKGQGAISNGESSVAAQLGPQASDRPEVIQMKAQAIARKADFDERTFLAFEQWREANPGGGFSRFLAQSTEFKDLKNDYLADLKAMREANARYFSNEKKPATSAAPAPAATPAAKPPANETVVDRFKREKAERERAAQGKP